MARSALSAVATHSYVLDWPVVRGAKRPVWPSKAPNDTLPFTIDFSKWLADTGAMIVSASPSSNSGLTVSLPQYVTTEAGAISGVTVLVGGGTPSATGQVRLLLILSSGLLDAVVDLPLTAADPDPMLGPGQTTSTSSVSATPTFEFDQVMPSAIWTIVHNLNKRPFVAVVTTAGDQVEGDVRYLSVNSLTITFAVPFAGSAFLD